MTTYNAASSAVHIALVPLSLLTSMLSVFLPESNKESVKDAPVRFGSEMHQWKSTTGITPVIEWQQHSTNAEELLIYFDGQYEKCVAEGSSQKN